MITTTRLCATVSAFGARSRARAAPYLGETHSRDGHHDLAVTALAQAREEFARLGHRHGQARAVEFLGQDAEPSGLPGRRLQLVHRAPPAIREPRRPRDTERLQSRITALAET
ncbi:hypothetical protein KV557_00910 [Kitasatospora aureofaciens]|uniref:hypothetical protein n=1 Tax=Kitasatospora aureofaciens TaxID=1894 RepID=UPI001C457A77|nr:hypothetical protein [Kitasatospora aureofaciens]MBV6695683.1 hypothetical protein [Kitasatospora aureofaciens]